MDLVYNNVIIGIAFGLSLVSIVVGCLRCKRSLSEKELQQKYFEKFRKRHIVQGPLSFSKQVDYVRKLSLCEENNTSVSASSPCEPNNNDDAYQVLSSPKAPEIKVQEASVCNEQGFFDESLQTVIEASSVFVSGSQSISHCLSVQTVSYLSLRNCSQSSQSDNQSSTSSESLETQLAKNGAVNEAYDSTFSTSEGQDSQDSLEESYFVPRHGPKVKVVQPSVRYAQKLDTQVVQPSVRQGPILDTQVVQQSVGQAPLSDTQMVQPSVQQGPILDTQVVQPSVRKAPTFDTPQNNFSKRFLELESQQCSSFRRHSDIGVPSSHFENEIDIFDCSVEENGSLWEEAEDALSGLHDKNVHKMIVEGPSHYNNRRRSYDSMSLYEKLRQSKIEENLYKSLHKKRLMLPSRTKTCSPLSSKTVSSPVNMVTPLRARTRDFHVGYSDHTYECIAADLASELNNRDLADVVINDLDSNLNDNNTEHDVRRSPYSRQYSFHSDPSEYSCVDHTYESIQSRPRSQSVDDAKEEQDACDNSVVIIGRRVSNPFENGKFAKRLINKKKQNITKDTDLLNLPMEKKFLKEHEDRYSPFPSAKKLAFKSAFSRVASPRFILAQKIQENLEHEFNASQELCMENLNIKTPEIKVENTAQRFNNTAFLSPICLKDSVFRSGEHNIDPHMVTKEIAYQTLKACENLKYNRMNLDTGNVEKLYKKSLPSLPDCLDEDIVNHCNLNAYAMSTPCNPVPQTCNYF